VLPEQTEEFTMPAQQRLRLDKEKRLFPGSNHPGEELCWLLGVSVLKIGASKLDFIQMRI